MAVPHVHTALRVAADTLRSNPLRTILSTLGVIIGVASLVAVLSLGDGIERLARAEVENTTSLQSVTVASRTSETIDGETYPRHDYPVFTQADVRAIRDEVPGVLAALLVASGRTRIEVPKTGKRRTSTVSATLADAVSFTSMRFAAGRFFTAAEASRNAPVVVVSWSLAEELAAGRDPLGMLGQRVRVGSTPREIIGIHAPYTGEMCCGASIPFAGAMTTFGKSPIPTLMLKARTVEAVDTLKVDVEDWLGARYGRGWERRVRVETSTMRLEQVQRGMLTFKLFMGAITGISLLVGGIGIMNVLLASVTERTREIGVRKATGARRVDILAQFLAESVVISGAGSVIGVIVGLLGAFGITAIIRARSANRIYIDAAFSWETLAVAVGSAVIVGLVFGTYPARRAARLSPIDAIRHE